MLKTWKDRLFLAALVVAAVVGVVGWLQWFDDDHGQHDRGVGTLTIPAFTADAEAGQAVFDENCVTCHGPHATGSDQGPPLVHKIYEPQSPRRHVVPPCRAERGSQPSLGFWQHGARGGRLS